MIRKIALFSAALIAATAGAEPPAAPTRLTFDAIFGEAPATEPQQISWGPRGERLSYVWTESGETALRVLDVASGETRQILHIGGSGSAELPAVEILKAHHWSPDGTRLLLESKDALYGLELAGGKLERWTREGEEVKNPRFSPDGTLVAFVRDWDLYVRDLRTSEVRRLTEGGKEDEILNGITDWVYWEEIWGRTSSGFWWSPDSRAIAYYQFDERDVPSYPMVDFTGTYPRVEWQKYPKAGETNPKVRLGVVELESRSTRWLETGGESDAYLARVDWLPDGDRIAVQRLNRDQDRLDVLTCDAHTGTCDPRLSETSETWVNLTEDLTFLPDGSFLWTSEASGWRRLALHAADGRRLRQLSPDGWNVTAVDGLGGSGTTAVYTAHSTAPLGALHRTVFEVPLAGGEATALTAEESWSRAAPAPEGRRLVTWTSRADTPTRIETLDPRGDVEQTLPDAPRPGLSPEALARRRFLTIPGPNGVELPAMLMAPERLDPERRYPAIMYHYGCPASQVVADRWSWRARFLWHAMMVERGYVVLMVDNLASNFFGKHGHDRAHRRFGEGNLAAQKAGVAYLESLGYVDTGRIGLWGGSGGGYNTLYSLLGSPGTWRAGVAFAPVTDWRLYDTIWTERYLDHPDDNPDGYRDSSATTHAAELRDPLLMVHGTADDNVHPQNTLVMARALVAAGRPFEMSIHPRQKHGFRGADLRHFYERMTEFFDRHLGPTEAERAAKLRDTD